MDKYTILVVDDDFLNLQVFGKVLRENNFNVVVATRGTEALDYLKDGTPDLILLDVMMPEMDGFETCLKIKAIPRLQSIPVLFLSALNDIDEMVKGLDYGALDYIIKPYNSKLLVSKIRIHLDLKTKTIELENLNKTLEEKVKLRTHELEIANSELLQLDEAKSEFLKIISHEIRTPLNGIMGFTSLIKDTCIAQGNMERFIQLIDDSVKRLERFSYDALIYTELKTKKFIPKKIKISLRHLIDDILNNYKKNLTKKEIQVDNKIPDNFIVEADSSLMHHCLRNIIDNAVKFSPEKSQITIQSIIDQNKITCRIIDEGKGFSEKALRDMFKLFKPGHEFVDQNEGIGLALCKLIMHVHDGEIIAFNHGNGATVDIIFKD